MENEKKLYQKWWFWIIMLIIVAIIAVTLVILIAFNMINPDKNLTNLSKELKQYDNNIAVYQSSGKNTILINCYAKDKNEMTDKSKDIGKIMGEHIEYLSIYEDIVFYFYTDEGEKATFTFDIDKREVKEKDTETWILEDSTAQKNIENEIKELEEKKEILSKEISGLENEKSNLDTSIEKLNSDIIKLKGEPKTYPAGKLVVGVDVPIGKYKIYDGSSNFVVYSSYGKLEVNIILGKGSHGISEYIYTFKEDDKIEADSSFKLVAIE